MKLAKNVWDHVSTCVRGVRGVTRWSTLKNCHIDWVGSILVNGILNLRLSGCSGITSSKYRNVKIDVVSCPNLRRLLGIMYHMLKHGSTRFWPFWWLIWGFIRGFSHLTSHTGLCEIRQVGPKTHGKQLLFFSCHTDFFPFARKSGFCARNYSYEIIIYGQTEK